MGGAVSTLLDLITGWERLAATLRQQAATSKTAAGMPNPECCRSNAVTLEQTARELREIVGIPREDSIPPAGGTL
jgi:hypothetical protein